MKGSLFKKFLVLFLFALLPIILSFFASGATYYLVDTATYCGYYVGTSASCGAANTFCGPGKIASGSTTCTRSTSGGSGSCGAGYCDVCGDCDAGASTCGTVACGVHGSCTGGKVCTGAGQGASYCVNTVGEGQACNCDDMCTAPDTCVGNVCTAPAGGGDSTPPNVTINTGLNNTVFITDTPTIDYTFYDNQSSTANCTLYFNGTDRNTTNNVANGTATKYLKVTSPLADSTYNVYINCTDNASNVGKSGVLNVEIDTTAPAITGVINWSINSTGAKINWTTDEVANASVKYGTTVALGDGTRSYANLLTTHVINLTGLSPDQKYYYNITSCDVHGNCNMTGPYNFNTTAAPDDTAPAITGVINWSINSSAAKVNWTTDESANGSIKYGLSLAMSDGTVTHSNLILEHLLIISGLSPSLLYYFNVSSCDVTGNCNMTGPYSFTTTAGPDLTPPTVYINPSLNNTFTSNTRPSVDFNFTDAGSSTANCTLYFDSLPYNTTNNINKDIQTTLTVNTSLSPDNYSVFVNCTDNASNVGKSGVIWIVADNVTPTVKINASLNNTAITDTTPDIRFNFTDSLSNTANCTLFFNETPYGNSNDASNASQILITANSSISNGRYNVYINCTDKANNIGKSTFLNLTITAVVHNVTSPPVGTKYRLESDDAIDVTKNGQAGLVKVLVGLNTTSGNYSGIIVFNFTQSIDVSSITMNTSRALAKSVVHNAAGITGFVNLSLLIPKINSTGVVYICPNAQTLDQVNTSCSGLINISTGQSLNGMTVSEVTYDTEAYYLIENVTGTGGGEGAPTTTNPLQCFFIRDNTCPAGTARLIGAENDTHSGFNNSHAQNNSYHTYNYSICCNNTNTSITITNSCNATVLKLSNSTNAHVEIGDNSNYSVSVCLGSTWKRVFCNYPTGSCATGYACIMSMAGNESTNTSNAHVGGCNYYDQKVCCALVNSAPTKASLYYPGNNTNISARMPNFNWTASTDPEGDSITYSLNVSCGACSASCYQPNIGSITTANYTVQSALCLDTYYNWSVTACDIYGDCNASYVFNFTVKSLANLILIINASNFGGMSIGQNNDTTDRSPTQLVAANIGNVIINVTINASALFSSAGLGTYYYQYEASVNKTNSFITAYSQMTFNNMSGTAQTLFCNMTYENNTATGNNTGNIELNITVPLSESPGNKSSSIEVGYYAIS